MSRDSDKTVQSESFPSLQGYLIARGNHWLLYLLTYKGNMRACMHITSTHMESSYPRSLIGVFFSEFSHIRCMNKRQITKYLAKTEWV